MGPGKYSGLILPFRVSPSFPSSFLPSELKSKDATSSVSDLLILTKVTFHIFKLFFVCSNVNYTYPSTYGSACP